MRLTRDGDRAGLYRVSSGSFNAADNSSDCDYISGTYLYAAYAACIAKTSEARCSCCNDYCLNQNFESSSLMGSGPPKRSPAPLAAVHVGLSSLTPKSGRATLASLVSMPMRRR